MLTITHEAAEAIDSVVHAAPDAPDTAGLRIARGVAPDGQEGLSLSVTTGPAPDDAVLEAEGTPVFLDQEAADILDGPIGFMLREQ